MTITIRQKALANDNISLYLDIYDGGKACGKKVSTEREHHRSERVPRAME